VDEGRECLGMREGGPSMLFGRVWDVCAGVKSVAMEEHLDGCLPSAPGTFEIEKCICDIRPWMRHEPMKTKLNLTHYSQRYSPSTYARDPRNDFSSPLLMLKTAVRSGLLSPRYSTSCINEATPIPLSVAPGAVDTES
jgi:hypothetical protein